VRTIPVLTACKSRILPLTYPAVCNNTWINMPAKKSVNFEKALAELEKLVEEMEQGNLSLEESLKRFEKGISLTSDCQQALQNAELKVQELIEKNGELVEKDFEVDQ
jgi:exodeoxyribonuclease VII small subunit